MKKLISSVIVLLLIIMQCTSVAYAFDNEIIEEDIEIEESREKELEEDQPYNEKIEDIEINTEPEALDDDGNIPTNKLDDNVEEGTEIENSDIEELEDDENLELVDEKVTKNESNNVDIKEKAIDIKVDTIEKQQKNEVVSSTQNYNVSINAANDGERTIADGEYKIRCKANTAMLFDIDGGSNDNSVKLQLWSDCNASQQRFIVKYLGDGTYSIQVKKSLKMIDVVGGRWEDGTGVQQYDDNGTDAQRWIIKDVGNGSYKIMSKCNSLYMTTSNDKYTNGTRIVMSADNNSSTQLFIFERIVTGNKSQILENGEYRIKSKINENMVFDIDGGSNNNCAKLQLWANCNVSQQRYIINYLGDGTYSIEVKKSGKKIEVIGAHLVEGTGIQQYDCNWSDAQKWILEDVGNGYFCIISKCNNLYMTVDNTKCSNGTGIKMYLGNGGEEQIFKIERIDDDAPTRTIDDGEYEIRCSSKYGKVLDVDGGSNQNCAKIQVWDDCDVVQQRYYIKYLGDGLYDITIRKSGKSVDVVGGQSWEGVGVQQYEKNGTKAQKWIIKDNGDGTYSLISKCNNLYMTICNSNVNNGTKVAMYKNRNNNTQKFIFDKVIKDNAYKTIEDGIYRIKSSVNNYYVFDIDGGSSKNGARAQLWSNVGVPQQKFKVNYIGDGLYRIVSCQSNKCLDVAGASIKKGTPVQQYDSNNTEAQKWIIKDNGDGTYSLISRCNGYYVTAVGENVKNGTGLQMFESWNNNYQKFVFEEIKDLNGIDVSAYNNTIDWAKVKNAGIDFAFIRIGYRGYESGKVVFDKKYEYNIKNAINNNIDVGVYFYSQATSVSEAIDEANFCINNVKGYNITYPIVFDSEYATSAREGRADNLSKSKRTEICIAFCETIKKAGYTPMIYASKSWFYDQLDMSKLSKYKIWVAHYTDNVNRKTDFKYTYDIWQYTSKGKVQGIGSDYVDRNILYGK